MNTAPKNILVADEQPLLIWALENALASHGVHVLKAANGEEVRDLMRRGSFDGVILSCQLLDEDMSDVIVEIDRYMPDVRLVALCRGGCADRLQARLGRGTVIDSPFEIDDVRAAILATGSPGLT